MITISKKLIITVLGIIVVIFGIIAVLRFRLQPAIAPSITDTVQGQETAPNAKTVSSPAVESLKIFLSENLGISEGEIEIINVTAKDWPDACLGLAKPGQFCAQVITAGYEINVRVNNQELKYRTNTSGSAIRQDTGGNDNFLKG